jgi:putative ABC transport system permease protein
VTAGGRGGGVAARRAVVRWAWRMFRREWRQQILVLGLLTLTVGGAIFGASAAYHVVSSPAGQFGRANHLLSIHAADPRVLRAGITAARQWFGTIDVIAHRHVRIPGSTETFDLRAQDPRGPYAAPMLRLTGGRYPATAGEVAVTDEVAATFRVRVGSPLTLARRTRTVVGLVENPGNLTDEFALVPPSQLERPEDVTILVNATRERVESFPAAAAYVSGRRWNVTPRGQNEQSAAAAGALAAATVLLLLVALIAAAGFVVVAQRRQRQLGMLAAVGATAKHLRLVLLVNGAVVGAVAAVIGTAAGVALWIAIAPRLETVAQHRIDRLDLPWWLVGAGVVLAVTTATGAAWWPARAVARLPITLSLSGRPPQPKPAHRSAVLAGVLFAAGVVCLATGIDSTRDSANPILVISGTLATALGILLISPPAIRMLRRTGPRLPIAVRLALRDLARHQARAGAALAAISLTLGISVAIAIGASAAKYGAAEGNLSDRQLLITIGDYGPLVPERAPAELESLTAQVSRYAATLDKASVVPLDVAVSTGAKEHARGGAVSPYAVLARRISETTNRFSGYLYVATPELLRRAGLSLASAAPGTDVLSNRTGDLKIENVNGANGARPPTPRVQRIDVPSSLSYSSAPTSFITPYGMRRGGWRAVRAGWLVETRSPLTAGQRAAARDMAASAGLTVEVRRAQPELSVIRSGATAVGVLFALGVLAMTVGLIRGEAAGDIRTLTAVGATGVTRRTLTATTTGTLALLGALIGTVGAYAGMAAGYMDEFDALSRVPVAQLTITVIGLPLAAALAGWALARREPPALARRAMD